MSLTLSRITKPTLLLDARRAKTNIQTMMGKAKANGLRFRPHFKTHQSATVGEWFRAAGVTAITVSSVDMARYFADHDWGDITIAFPVNVREIDEINALAARVNLHLLADSSTAIDRLADELIHDVNVWIEVDTGYKRSGVRWDDGPALDAIAASLTHADRLNLRGLLAHAGHTYGVRSTEEVAVIYDTAVERMRAARDDLAATTGVHDLEISIGDTPACSMLDDLWGVDEMRPGNFVFYDLTQWQIGACEETEIAVAVACPVVAIYPDRHEFVLYGGAIHLAKEALARPDGSPDFGHIAFVHEEGWAAALAGVYLRSVSQEHGVVAVDSTIWSAVAHTLQIGDLVAVLPVHSCLTANLLKRYVTLNDRRIEMASIP